LYNRVVSTGGVAGATEIVGLLRRPIIGVAQERLGDADTRGIANGQLGRNYLSEEMRVDRATEFAIGDRADDPADPFRGKRPAAVADPERVAGDRRRRTPHQLLPVMGDISFDPPGEDIWEGDLERSPIF
jgi:hypothetical protein